MAIEDDAGSLRRRLVDISCVLELLVELFAFLKKEDRWLRWQDGTRGPADLHSHTAEMIKARWARATTTSLEQPGMSAMGHELHEVRELLNQIVAARAIDPQQSFELVTRLRGIDAAFIDVHPLHGLDTGSRYAAELRDRLRQGSTLFDRDGWKVLPRPRPRQYGRLRGARIEDLLDNLSVFLAPDNVAVDYHSFQGWEGDSLKRIGVVPLIHSPDELDWQAVGDALYTVSVRPESLPKLLERLTAALDWLQSQKAQLVVLPELVSSPELRRHIQLHLNDLALRDEPFKALCLAGSQIVNDEDDGLRNRAELIDWRGDVKWHQDKLHPYTFTSAEQQATGLSLGDKPVDRQEAISLVPRRLCIRDVGPNLRSAVLVCEDFKQPEPHGLLIQNLDVNLILVPVMNGPRARLQDWIGHAGISYANRPEATSVMGNSGALLPGRRPNQRWKPDFYVELVGHPPIRGIKWQFLPARPSKKSSHPIALFCDLPER